MPGIGELVHILKQSLSPIGGRQIIVWSCFSIRLTLAVIWADLARSALPPSRGLCFGEKTRQEFQIPWTPTQNARWLCASLSFFSLFLYNRLLRYFCLSLFKCPFCASEKRCFPDSRAGGQRPTSGCQSHHSGNHGGQTHSLPGRYRDI